MTTEVVPQMWASMSSDERHREVKRLAHDFHMSAGQIAKALYASRNAVVGVVHRSKTTSDPITLFRATVAAQPRADVARRRATTARRRPKPASLPDRIVRIRAPRPEVVRGLFGGPAWEPIPGSAPVPLLDLDRRGCRWPVRVNGEDLFCNQPARDTGPCYCEHHARLSVIGE